ncbi:superoxide dismutase [Patescibacteria group bacterium]|nr:superoxide dismutase [Patescibacteria group bacterium]
MFVLPELKNPYNAYEPYLDAETMEIHHQKHHGGYVKKLNQACVEEGMECSRIEDLFDRAADLSPAVRNNAGGHYNHTVFWTLLNPGMSTPSPELKAKIDDAFGTLDDFKAEFTKAALGVFGSGWTWLVVNGEGKLEIVSTKLQDNPLMSDVDLGYPILGVDVWEHAYYLRYRNERVEYLKAIWALIDWNVVSERFSTQPTMNDLA